MKPEKSVRVLGGFPQKAAIRSLEQGCSQQPLEESKLSRHYRRLQASPFIGFKPVFNKLYRLLRNWLQNNPKSEAKKSFLHPFQNYLPNFCSLYQIFQPQPSGKHRMFRNICSYTSGKLRTRPFLNWPDTLPPASLPPAGGLMMLNRITQGFSAPEGIWKHSPACFVKEFCSHIQAFTTERGFFDVRYGY